MPDSVKSPIFWSLYRVLAVQFGFTLLQLTYTILRTLLWMVTEIYWKVGAYQYEKSAHVQHILMRYKFDALAKENQLEDFITCHDSFQDPEYVLKDEVSLYAITSNKAIYVEVPRDKADIWRGKHGAFVRFPQYLYAIKVITMPHHSFLRLTDRLGDTRSQVMLLKNTARCGSTLLCRVFEETGVCVSWSEPEGLNNIIKLVMDNVITDKAVGRRLVRAVIRMYCKPVLSWGDEQPLGYCLKLISPAIAGAELLYELCPEYKQLFMYRHGETMMRSFEDLAEAAPLIKLATLMCSLHPSLTKMAAHQAGCSANLAKKVNFKLNYHICEMAIVIWSTAISVYVDCWKKKLPMKAVKFEDLIGDSQYSIGKIFNFFCLPETLVKPAMKAFEKDSQANSPSSRKSLNKLRKRVPLNAMNVRCMNQTCAVFGVPNWCRDVILPETITHRPVQDDPLYISDQELLEIFNSAGC